MDAIVSNATLQDAIVDGQLAAVDRLRSKDFAGTLLGFVDRILAAPRAPRPHVTFDFWQQFDAAQELEELRLYPPGDLSRRCRRIETQSCRVAMIVNQWVPAAHRGDAIGDSARRVRDLLRAHGPRVGALRADDRRRPARATCGRSPIRRRARGDVTIFHYALPSPMTAAFASLARRPRAAVPQRHAGGVLRALRSGAVPPRVARPRRSWRRSSGRVDLALGDSDYNRQELEALGFAPHRRLSDRRRHRARSPSRSQRPALEQILDDGLVNFLFVGRIAPNKKIEDHIRLAELYKRYVDAYYRFIFVGRYDVVPRYYSMIRALMTRVPAAATTASSSPARCPDEELAVYYRHAAVYISLSEHEGFCVPLVEAMAADVPVLAYAAGAVPDTLGGAGVQFAPKDLEYAAELLGALAFDDDLRASVIAGQRRRLADFGDDAHHRASSTRAASHRLS